MTKRQLTIRQRGCLIIRQGKHQDVPVGVGRSLGGLWGQALPQPVHRRLSTRMSCNNRKPLTKMHSSWSPIRVVYERVYLTDPWKSTSPRVGLAVVFLKLKYRFTYQVFGKHHFPSLPHVVFIVLCSCTLMQLMKLICIPFQKKNYGNPIRWII